MGQPVLAGWLLPARTGALLDEVTKGIDSPDRIHAAIMLGLEGCRRGLKRLERLIDEMVKAVEANDSAWVGPPERGLLACVLIAVGHRDTEASHALLARLIRESSSHLVRADALEGTAYEKERFDLDLVLPFTSMRAQPPEILSALYALEFRARDRPEEIRERVAPLLAHPYGMIRCFAVRVLMFRDSNLDLILPLTDDPEPQVREAVEEAIRWIEADDEDEVA